MFSVVLCLALVACGGKDSDKPIERPDVAEEVEDTEGTETEDEAETEFVEKDDVKAASSNATFKKNDTKLYPGAEEIGDVPMGVVEDGTAKQYCTITIPTSYGYTTMNMDEKGNENPTPDMPNYLSEAYELGYMDGFLASRVGVAGEGLSLDAHIVSSEIGSIKKGKEAYPGGKELSVGNRMAYISEFVNELPNKTDKYVIYIIDLSDNWTLFVQYGGTEELDLSLEEYADEFAKIIVEESIAKEEPEEPENTEKASSEGSDINIFTGSEEWTEIEMGITESDTPKALIKIKLPKDYYFGGGIVDESGEKYSEPDMEGMLSTIISQGQLVKYLPGSAYMSSYGEENHMFNLAFLPSNKLNVSDERASNTGGVSVGEGKEHEAYIYEYEDSWRFVYKVDDSWTILSHYMGDDQGKLSIEEFGQELYNIITPMD